MSTALPAPAVVPGAVAVGVAVMALPAGWRAVRIGGRRLPFDGLDRVLMPAAAAHPHLCAALRRRGCAMACRAPAAIAAPPSGAPA